MRPCEFCTSRDVWRWIFWSVRTDPTSPGRNGTGNATTTSNIASEGAVAPWERPRRVARTRSERGGSSVPSGDLQIDETTKLEEPAASSGDGRDPRPPGPHASGCIDVLLPSRARDAAASELPLGGRCRGSRARAGLPGHRPSSPRRSVAVRAKEPASAAVHTSTSYELFTHSIITPSLPQQPPTTLNQPVPDHPFVQARTPALGACVDRPLTRTAITACFPSRERRLVSPAPLLSSVLRSFDGSSPFLFSILVLLQVRVGRAPAAGEDARPKLSE